MGLGEVAKCCSRATLMYHTWRRWSTIRTYITVAIEKDTPEVKKLLSFDLCLGSKPQKEFQARESGSISYPFQSWKRGVWLKCWEWWKADWLEKTPLVVNFQTRQSGLGSKLWGVTHLIWQMMSGGKGWEMRAKSHSSYSTGDRGPGMSERRGPRSNLNTKTRTGCHSQWLSGFHVETRVTLVECFSKLLGLEFLFRRCHLCDKT